MNATLILSPRDGLFLKDGRGWFTAGSGRAGTLQWPFPSTVLGALRTAAGRHKEVSEDRRLSPEEWKQTLRVTLGSVMSLRRPLSVKSWTAAHRLWPVPADALFFTDGADGLREVLRLDPVRPSVQTLGRKDDPAREALWRPQLSEREKPARPPTWWTEEAFVDWLADPREHRDGSASLAGLEVPRRVQAHVGIAPDTGAAKESVLFSHEVIETLETMPANADPDRHHEWALGCAVAGAAPSEFDRLITLGGDRRLARLEPAGDALLAVPSALPEAADRQRPKGLRLVAVTPLIFGRGWLPDGLEPRNGVYAGTLVEAIGELELRAVFVPRPLYVSGWDMVQNAPKRTDRLVPPGAVFFVVRRDGAGFDGPSMRRFWLTALGRRTDEGYGRVVAGLWHPKEEQP